MTIWNLESKTFIGSIHLERVRGIARTADQKGLWLTYGASGALGRIELDNFELTPAAGIARSLIGGSHLLNWPEIGWQ
jgi:hypothetical protein